MKIAALTVLLLALSASAQHAAPVADPSFDAPIKKTVVNFGASPHHPAEEGQRMRLTCYLFPSFMVKEYDEGEVGAEWLSILPVTKGATPACTRDHVPGERVLNPDDWSGYFKGARGNLVFFDSGDGVNGGLPFAIFDASTARKLFEDTAFDTSLYTHKPAPSPFNRLRIFGDATAGLTLRYLRVVAADCDLHTEKAPCWQKITAKLGLGEAPMPVCTDYARARGRRWPSAVAYPVEVTLSPSPTTRPIPGPVKCWPAD